MGFITMQIFAEDNLQDFLIERRNRLRHEVDSEEKNQLLNYNETEYTEYLIGKYYLDPLVFHWDGVSVTDREDEVEVSKERFLKKQLTKKQIITYHLPFSGSPKLLRFQPSSYITWTMEVSVRERAVCFDIVNWDNDPSKVGREAATIQSRIKKLADEVNRDLKSFNSNLETFASRVFKERKEELLTQSDLLASLGVPIKKAEHTPDTFSVPISKKRIVIEKPQTVSTPYTPEPTLDPSVYQQILQMCHDLLVEIERHPSLYEDKDEPSLRDHFLMMLSPHFDSATGETFNKTGKTDILIRHEHSNVFVAECKFWRGAKHFRTAIDQALGYLTWRDSKVAVLCFIRNKQIEPVLDKIQMTAKQHPCFVKYKGKVEDGWFSFDFHLPEDPTRGISLNILCSHFPEAS